MEGTRKAAIKVVEGGKRRVLRDDFTGRVERVNTHLLDLLLDNGYTPVLCPPALSYDSEIINVDGDRAAAVVAVACKAETLVILSNVPGLLRDIDDADSLVHIVGRDQLGDAMDIAQGRMKKKVMGAREALEGGVGKVILGDARLQQPIRRALDECGTVLR